MVRDNLPGDGLPHHRAEHVLPEGGKYPLQYNILHVLPTSNPPAVRAVGAAQPYTQPHQVPLVLHHFETPWNTWPNTPFPQAALHPPLGGRR